MKQVPVSEAMALKYPEWVMFVISRDGEGAPDLMPAGWCMICNSNPLMMAVEVATGRVLWQTNLVTAYGASAMAVQSDLDVTELRQRVTTKGGTTEAAMERLNAGHFEELIDAAIAAATRRGQELAENGAHT